MLVLYGGNNAVGVSYKIKVEIDIGMFHLHFDKMKIHENLVRDYHTGHSSINLVTRANFLYIVIHISVVIVILDTVDFCAVSLFCRFNYKIYYSSWEEFFPKRIYILHNLDILFI